MKILTSLFSLVLFSLFAQESTNLENEPKSLKHSLGLHSGVSTGQGFSYRYFPNKWGVQVTGIPIFNGNQSFYTSSAFTILYKIKEHRKIDLFTYLGNHLIFQRYESFIYPAQWADPWEALETSLTTVKTYTIGFGAGVNIHLWEVLDLSLQAGYGLTSWRNSPIYTNFSSEIGLYYKF